MFPQVPSNEVEDAQTRGLKEFFQQETLSLLQLARQARAACLVASPQAEPVRQLLYSHFMACARTYYKADEIASEDGMVKQ